MKHKPHILVIEDEEAIRCGLIDVFVFHGYLVDSCADGRDGLHKAQSGKYDLILLDVMLPEMNGFDVCNAIRNQDLSQRIIMLTAKNSDDDIIKGLKLGADDYISKPFSLTELLLRVEAVLRRALTDTANAPEIVLSGDIRIDSDNLTGTLGERKLIFTRREIDILRYLAANGSRPVTRQELLAKVWGYARNHEIETRTVDIHIAKLRRKIEVNPQEPVNLVTVRGAGYRLLTDSSHEH